MSTGSVLFAGATDNITEDNTNFFWDNTNKRLGIGTNTPTTLLNVRGNYAGVLDNSIPQLLFENANNTTSANLSAIIRARISTGYSGGFPEIWIDTTRDSSNNGFTRVRTVSNHPLSFWTNDTERVRLFSGGNLLIQTGGTFTDTGERLQVSGSSKFVGNMVITGSATITAGVGVSGTSAFTIGSGTNFTLNGAVGGQLAYSYAEYIGALYYAGFSGVTVGMRGSSAVLLGNTATSYPFAVVNDRVAIGHISPTALLHISGSTGGLLEIDSNTSANILYVSSSGNVGIGTASPSFRLDVSGSSRFAGDMVITGSGATSGTNGLNIVNSNLISTLIVRNDGRISNGDNTFYVDRYSTGGTTMVLSVNGHNGATGIEVTNAVGIRASSNLGVSVNNALGASIYAAGGNTNGPTNISLGLLSNRALITSTASGMAMHTSSMLQVDSTTQGFLPPRMTAAQRTAILTPARGLLVYDIDSATEGLWMYNSGSTPGWQEVLTNSGSQSISGSLTVTQGITGSLFGTSSWATNVVTASYVLNAISSSFASTASYALNGGVTQIIAGTNVTISPASGTGSVTINATGGGGAAFPFTGSALITGSLVITGSTTSTLGFTGSLFGTSSWAQNAATASYATSFYVSGTLNVGKTNIEFQENTNVTSGTWRVVSSEPTASYKAAFFDYVMFSGSIARAGTVYSVWSASYAEYYENYTGDVGGSTAGVSLQAAISGSNIQLQATASNNGWTIRSLVRML